MSAHAWENSKENIRPLRGGRDPALLARALPEQRTPGGASSSAVASGAASARAGAARGDARDTRASGGPGPSSEVARFEAALREAEAGRGQFASDPLAVWTGYVQHLQQTTLDGSAAQARVLERAAYALEGDARYLNDRRYVRIWLWYACTRPDALEMYAYMRARGVGRRVALFYECWALEFEHAKMFDKARAALALGLQNDAAPPELLAAKTAEFEARMAARARRDARRARKATERDAAAAPPGQENASAARRPALAARSRPRAQRREAPPARQQAAPPSAAPTSAPQPVQPRPTDDPVGQFRALADGADGREAFDVFIDGAAPEQTPDEILNVAEGDDRPFPSIVREARSNRENRMDPAPWRGARIKLDQRRMAAIQARQGPAEHFEVYRDPPDAPAPAAPRASTLSPVPEHAETSPAARRPQAEAAASEAPASTAQGSARPEATAGTQKETLRVDVGPESAERSAADEEVEVSRDAQPDTGFLSSAGGDAHSQAGGEAFEVYKDPEPSLTSKSRPAAVASDFYQNPKPSKTPPSGPGNSVYQLTSVNSFEIYHDRAPTARSKTVEENFEVGEDHGKSSARGSPARPSGTSDKQKNSHRPFRKGGQVPKQGPVRKGTSLPSSPACPSPTINTKMAALDIEDMFQMSLEEDEYTMQPTIHQPEQEAFEVYRDPTPVKTRLSFEVYQDPDPDAATQENIEVYQDPPPRVSGEESFEVYKDASLNTGATENFEVYQDSPGRTAGLEDFEIYRDPPSGAHNFQVYEDAPSRSRDEEDFEVYQDPPSGENFQVYQDPPVDAPGDHTGDIVAHLNAPADESFEVYADPPARIAAENDDDEEGFVIRPDGKGVFNELYARFKLGNNSVDENEPPKPPQRNPRKGLQPLGERAADTESAADRCQALIQSDLQDWCDLEPNFYSVFDSSLGDIGDGHDLRIDIDGSKREFFVEGSAIPGDRGNAKVFFATMDDPKTTLAGFKGGAAQDGAIALKVQPDSSWEFYVYRTLHKRSGELVADIPAALAVFDDRAQGKSALLLGGAGEGSLAGVLGVTGGGRFDEAVALFLAAGLLRALERAHGAGIVHGDVTLDNVLLRSADDGARVCARFSAAGAGGWDRVGVSLVDFNRAVDTRHRALDAPDAPVGAGRAPDAPTFAADCRAAAACAARMLGLDGLDVTSHPHLLDHEPLWLQLFARLGALPPDSREAESAAAMRACREPMERALESDAGLRHALNKLLMAVSAAKYDADATMTLGFGARAQRP